METDQIICGDCLDVMARMDSESVDLVVTSPPYNKGHYSKARSHGSDNWHQRHIIYDGFEDDLDPEVYITQQKRILTESLRTIRPQGSVFYNVKPIISQHRIIYPAYVYDFNVRQQIIWDRLSTNQLGAGRFFPTTELIFWITKTNIQPKFKRGDLKFQKEVWSFPMQAQPDHPAPFPIGLPLNCILATTDIGDIVCDPFNGIGNTSMAALKTGRHYIGIEISPEYCAIANERIRIERSQLKLDFS